MTTFPSTSNRDPSSEVPFSDVLYANDAFVGAIANSLGDDGVFVCQLGEEDETGELPPSFGASGKLVQGFFDQLKRHFSVVTDYNDASSEFEAPWSYVISFKSDTTTKQSWYSTPAEFDLRIQKRAIPTHTGQSPFRYVDCSTIATKFARRHF